MTTYADTSVLLPLYLSETFSAAADTAVSKAERVPFTALHRLEMLNALELAVGRKRLTSPERRAIDLHMQQDLALGRLATLSLDLDRVFVDAGELSARYAAKFLARSLDLLHVAAAQQLSCTVFVSADDRQLAVASTVRLKTVDIKRRLPGGSRGPRRRTRVL